MSVIAAGLKVESGREVILLDRTLLDDKLLQAAKSGEWKAVQNYLDVGADINAVDEVSGNSLLSLSIYRGAEIALVREWIARGAAINENVVESLAVRNASGYEKLLFELLRNVKNDRSAMIEIALVGAARKGNLKVFLNILDVFGKDNQISVDDALITALEQGQLEGIDLALTLLNRGHQVSNAVLNIALDRATGVGHSPELVTKLIERGADANNCMNEATPLMNAARAGNLEVMRVLLKHGADIAKANKHGMTALMSAAKSWEIETLTELLQKGADVQAVDEKGRNSLMYLAGSLEWPLHESSFDLMKIAGDSKNISPCIEMLMKSGLNINATDLSGKTALMWAAIAGHDPVVAILMRLGADTQLKSLKGRTALEYARQYDRPVAVNLLVRG